MPFLWEQIVDLTYKPKFEIVRPEEAVRAIYPCFCLFYIYLSRKK